MELDDVRLVDGAVRGLTLPDTTLHVLAESRQVRLEEITAYPSSYATMRTEY